MTKQFVIIRHAKSSWAELGKQDFERPLNERGLLNAPEMGARLKKYGLQPDLILASAAKRTQQTANLIAQAMDYKNEIIFKNDLYHATSLQIENTICSLDNALNSVFIIAHNPGLTDFLIENSAQFVTYNMPTCAVAVFEMKADNWAEFYTAKKEILIYDFPKKTK